MSVLLFFSVTSFAGPPAQSGPNVIRGLYPNWFWYSDGELLVIHGLDIIQNCANQTIILEEWEGKAVISPSEEGLVIAQLKGEIGTWVFPWGLLAFNPDGSLEPFGTCYNALFNPEYPLLASGTSKVVVTDNNTQPLQNGSNRAKAWHLSAHGFLDTHDDGQVFLSGGFNCRWSGDPADESKCRIKVMVE